MTAPRRSWITVLADDDIRNAIRDAARAFIRDGCVHTHYDDLGSVTDGPEHCTCSENRVSPLDFADWLDGEWRAAQRDPVRFEPGKRPRKMKADQLSLSMVG